SYLFEIFTRRFRKILLNNNKQRNDDEFPIYSFWLNSTGTTMKQHQLREHFKNTTMRIIGKSLLNSILRRVHATNFSKHGIKLKGKTSEENIEIFARSI